MNLTMRKRVCYCTLLEMLSSTRVVDAMSSELRRWKNIKKSGQDAKDVQCHDAPPT